MVSRVAKGTSTSPGQLSPLVSVQEKKSRNKRRFRPDSPSGELNKFISSAQTEYPSYEFSAEKFQIAPSHGHSSACDLCDVNLEHSDGLKLDLGLSSAAVSSEVGSSQNLEELELEEIDEVDWSEFTESELEEIVFHDLDASFKSAIKKLVAHGYTEEVASKAVLRSGLCYGNKDTLTNIVENTLVFLRSGEDINNTSREHCFEDLQQLAKYLLAEQVCVLREVRPFFSTGDAMWNLLITHMNVSHYFTVDGDPSSSDETSSGSSALSTHPVPKTEDKSSESLPLAGVSNMTKSKNSHVFSGIVPKKEATSNTVHKTFSVAGTCQRQAFEEKFVGSSRKVYYGSIKREYILRQKSSHLEKNYRTYGSKGSSRAAKLSGFILDKKLKPVTDSTALKQASARISKAVGVDVPEDVHLNTRSALPNIPTVDTALPTADTELSLSLPSAQLPSGFSAEPSNFSFAGMPYDKSLGHWIPQDKKDETILKLVPKMREMENHLQEWISTGKRVNPTRPDPNLYGSVANGSGRVHNFTG